MTDPRRLCTLLAIVAGAPLAPSPARGDAFEAYTLSESFTLPEGADVYDVLADGRLVTLSDDLVYTETAVGSRDFVLLGALPGADFPAGPYGGPAFVRVSPSGTLLAVGNNGSSSWIDYRVGIFDAASLAGQWFPADHWDAEWFDDTHLALAAGATDATRVTVLDSSSSPQVPVNPVVIDNIGGASAGVTFDGAGNLYTGNGFQFTGPSDTGWVMAFSYQDWTEALSGGLPLDFEVQGTPVVDLLSAASLGFDARGNLHVGGGDFYGGTDNDYAGLVRNTAVADALAGGGTADPEDPEEVRQLDPDAAGASEYDVNCNSVTGELYLRQGITVYVYVAPESPFADSILDYAPAPGQYANEPLFNDPNRALGPPVGGGTFNPNNSSQVSLGGFGGSITVAFDHTVTDDPANPHCVDAIVFGNAFWMGGNPNRHWAECGTIEISRDANANGIADDPWYLIPGSHLSDPLAQFETQTWDDDLEDLTYPPFPVDPEFPYQDWIPPGYSDTWTTAGYRLPSDPFDTWILDNPHGQSAEQEGIYGYVDYTPTLVLGDLDADNFVDDPDLSPADFYTRPDDPLEVGITPGAGGGDGFDIAWAIDPETGLPADLDGFDFIRITNAVNFALPDFGEVSPEIDAVADVAGGLPGDGDWNWQIDLEDLPVLTECLSGPAIGTAADDCGCRTMDFDQDGDVDLKDFARWQTVFPTT